MNTKERIIKVGLRAYKKGKKEDSRLYGGVIDLSNKLIQEEALSMLSPDQRTEALWSLKFKETAFFGTFSEEEMIRMMEADKVYDQAVLVVYEKHNFFG